MLLSIIVIALIILLDFATKWLAVAYLEPIGSFPIIQDVLHLTYVTNSGAAFGMLSGENQRWIFLSVSVIAIAALFFYLFKYKPKDLLLRLGILFLIGGGIGNMIDRTILGFVIDFIDFTLIDFAVFNVADSFVTVGVGMLIVYLIREIVREGKSNKKGGENDGE